MKKTAGTLSLLLILILQVPALYSQAPDAGIAENGEKRSKKPQRELFHTYIGPVAAFGGQNIWFNGWDSSINQQTSYEYSGMFVKGGLMLNVFVKNFSGDFTVEYIYNMNQNYPVMHLFYRITGKYVFKVSEIVYLTAGAGGYFESPPSLPGTYRGGAGVQVPLGMVINTTFDTKMVIDFFARYGFYGMGENSSKLSYGMSIAFLFKVGRL